MNTYNMMKVSFWPVMQQSQFNAGALSDLSEQTRHSLKGLVISTWLFLISVTRSNTSENYKSKKNVYIFYGGLLE